MVTVQIADELPALIAEGDEPAERAGRELIVLELYRRGALSSGKAAEVLGMERTACIRHASRLGMPYLDMTEEEWNAEMELIDSLVASFSSTVVA